MLNKKETVVNDFVKGKAFSFAYGSFMERIYCPLTQATGQSHYRAIANKPVMNNGATNASYEDAFILTFLSRGL